jgi:hypothetical protein
VIANDIDPESLLDSIARNPKYDTCFTVDSRQFPTDTEYRDGSLASVHASLVFHFLAPGELETGLAKIARWLRPAGRLYALASSPFVGNFVQFQPTFQQRLEAGVRWPGYVERATEYASDDTSSNLPERLLLIDELSCFNACIAAGLQPEDAWYFRRRHLHARFHGDGRENIAIVASRPSGNRLLPIRSYIGHTVPKEEISELRNEVWRSNGWLAGMIVEDRSEERAADKTAIHWAAFDGSRMVAAARMHVAQNEEEIRWLSDSYPRIAFDRVLWPMAVISRLVVSESHRGIGLSTRLDRLRTQRALMMGARSILGLATGARARSLRSRGFRQIGFVPAADRRDGLLVDAEVLIRVTQDESD